MAQFYIKYQTFSKISNTLSLDVEATLNFACYITLSSIKQPISDIFTSCSSDMPIVSEHKRLKSSKLGMTTLVILLKIHLGIRVNKRKRCYYALAIINVHMRN